MTVKMECRPRIGVLEPDFELGVEGFRYSDLFKPVRLLELADRFDRFLGDSDPEAWSDWERGPSPANGKPPPPAASAILCRVSRHLSRFLGQLFRIEEDRERSIRDREPDRTVSRFKKEFVQRRALRAPAPESSAFALVDRQVWELLGAGPDDEYRMARFVCELLDLEAFLRPDPRHPRPPPPHFEERLGDLRSRLGKEPDLEAVDGLLDLFGTWCAGALREAKPGRYPGWTSLRFPEARTDPGELVRCERTDAAMPERLSGAPDLARLREGFKLTDPRAGPRDVLD